MTNYKATPEQWAQIEQFVKDCGHDTEYDACILELRDRIAALEAANQQPEPIDEAENERRFRACLAAIDNATPEQIRAAVAKASANRQGSLDSSPAPAGGLVERVAGIIVNGQACDYDEDRTACAAILAVAEWLDRCKLLYRGGDVPVRWLREEVECG